MSSRIAVRSLLVLVTLSSSIPARAQAPKPASKVIPAAEARDHLDETATVEMLVTRSRKADKQKSYYLDSEQEIDDPKNLAVVISFKHASAFKSAGIEDPAEHFRDKTIRVTGKIVKEGKQTRIRVESPRAIKVVDEK